MARWSKQTEPCFNFFLMQFGQRLGSVGHLSAAKPRCGSKFYSCFGHETYETGVTSYVLDETYFLNISVWIFLLDQDKHMINYKFSHLDQHHALSVQQISINSIAKTCRWNMECVQILTLVLAQGPLTPGHWQLIVGIVNKWKTKSFVQNQAGESKSSTLTGQTKRRIERFRLMLTTDLHFFSPLTHNSYQVLTGQIHSPLVASSFLDLCRVVRVVFKRCSICPLIWEWCATCRFMSLSHGTIDVKLDSRQCRKLLRIEGSQNCCTGKAEFVAILTASVLNSRVLVLFPGKKEENFGAWDKDHSSIWGLGASMCISNGMFFWWTISDEMDRVELVKCVFCGALEYTNYNVLQIRGPVRFP